MEAGRTRVRVSHQRSAEAAAGQDSPSPPPELNAEMEANSPLVALVSHPLVSFWVLQGASGCFRVLRVSGPVGFCLRADVRADAGFSSGPTGKGDMNCWAKMQPFRPLGRPEHVFRVRAFPPHPTPVQCTKTLKSKRKFSLRHQPLKGQADYDAFDDVNLGSTVSNARMPFPFTDPTRVLIFQVRFEGAPGCSLKPHPQVPGRLVST